MTAKETLKQWFSNLKKPNQHQFWAWLDSFWHKSEKIPMTQIEGLDNALQGVASDTQFQSHLTDVDAHKALFDRKVDKEDGKSLISDTERANLQENTNKRVVDFTITGDVNKVFTLIYQDGTTAVKNFSDIVGGTSADVMLNSLNFNKDTGVLTGVRSDGQQLTVDLNGRYALLDHSHTWNDILNKPDDLVSEAPNDGKDYLRSFNAWKAFTGWQFTELGQENLNDIKQAGFYGKYNSGEATEARNYPYNAIRGGHLLVLPMTLNASTLTVFQVYFSAGTQNQGDYTNTGRMFFRAFVNNAQWLPWVEFDGGKVHNFTASTQNLAQAFNNAFPNNESTFVLKQATTITIPRSRQVVRYIKATEADITFVGASGVNVVGSGIVNAPKGSLILVVCYDNDAYVCCDSKDSFVIDITANTTLNETHIGRTLRFKNTAGISIDISALPDGAMLSGVKHSGNGTVTITGTTAPTTDNVLNAIANSSFSLVKSSIGTSNLLMSNK
ncbi:MAG: pyocin knob domain-containing protein [Capnocytophaga sp.]|nr:pyocin knob domain-containing protein [Capnocytophaga sp.]